MGEVYKARDTRLDRTVAVKVLAEALAADPEFRHRFEREARAISPLTHPNICTVYDVGEQQGTAFLVMEIWRVDAGPSARAWAAAGGPGADDRDRGHVSALPRRTARRHSSRPEAGQHHADELPAPSCSISGWLRLALSSAVNSANRRADFTRGSHRTRDDYRDGPGHGAGAVEGQEADARTDLFSFGAVLYEMMTGRRAFEGATSASLIGAILKDDRPPVSHAPAARPGALDRVVKKCLAKDPQTRWQSACDLHDQLTWIAADRLTGARRRRRRRGRGRREQDGLRLRLSPCWPRRSGCSVRRARCHSRLTSRNCVCRLSRVTAASSASQSHRTDVRSSTRRRRTAPRSSGCERSTRTHRSRWRARRAPHPGRRSGHRTGGPSASSPGIS